MVENKSSLKQTLFLLAVTMVVSGLVSVFVFVKLYNYLPPPASDKSILKREMAPEVKEQGEIFKEREREEMTIKAVEKVSASVVNIIVSKYVSSFYSEEGNFFPDSFLKEFFPFEFSLPEKELPEEQKEKQEIAGGSGFVISQKNGLILTNKHVVVEQKADYTVISNDGEKYEAQVLARDPFNDVAILKVEKLNLPEVELGDSDKISVGQTVLAIGNALGEYRNTVTKGVVSGVGRRIVAGNFYQSEVLENVIQTDAAINFGNSGGPLINLKGEVIGINTAVNLQGQLIGFAIPINQVKSVIESVKETGKISRPFLGVRYVLLNKEMAKKNNLDVDYGALIVRGDRAGEIAVIPGSPADKADLKENDIILEINSKKITEKNSLALEIRRYKPGDKIKLKVLSKGKEKIIEVVLEEHK